VAVVANNVSVWWCKGDEFNRRSQLNLELTSHLQQQKAETEKLRSDMTQVTESIQVMFMTGNRLKPGDAYVSAVTRLP